VSGVILFANGKKVNTISIKDGCSAVALNGSTLAYGGAVSCICSCKHASRLTYRPLCQDKKIHLTTTDGGSETVFDDSRGELICLAFSSDGKYLAGGDVSVTDPPVQCGRNGSRELLADFWTYRPHRRC